MEKVQKDRTHPREKKSGKYPWDFKAPSYDNRSSCSMEAGNDYGIGFRQPVGTHTTSGIESGPIPMQSKCWDPKSTIARDEEG